MTEFLPDNDGVFARFKSRFWLLARVSGRGNIKNKEIKKRAHAHARARVDRPFRGDSVRGWMPAIAGRAPPCSLRSRPPAGDKDGTPRIYLTARNTPRRSMSDISAYRLFCAYGAASREKRQKSRVLSMYALFNALRGHYGAKFVCYFPRSLSHFGSG